MPDAESLPSIDLQALNDVTGGGTASGSTGSSSDDQVKAALEGISSALKDLGKNKNSNGGIFEQMLPFLLLTRLGGGGGSTVVCGCGCGGHGRCCRR